MCGNAFSRLLLFSCYTGTIIHDFFESNLRLLLRIRWVSRKNVLYIEVDKILHY